MQLWLTSLIVVSQTTPPVSLFPERAKMLPTQRTDVLFVLMIALTVFSPSPVSAQTDSDDLNTSELKVDAVEPQISLPEIRKSTSGSLRVRTISLGERQESRDGLVRLAQEAVDTTSRRLLSSGQHTPWQMMHALLGLRQEFAIMHQQQEVNGLEWMAQGQVYNGDQWFEKTVHGGRAHPYSVPYAFEGHANQMLAVLSMCGLETDHQFQTADGPITIADMIEHAKMTCDTKRDEPTWTLWALSRYLPPDAVWRNEDGNVCSIELLVEDQTKRPLKGAACGGTHGLFALAHARNVYLREGKPLRGVWLQSENKIRYYINTARRLQNPNGTLSSNYLRSRTYNPDFNKRMASAGHVLEFLMLALPQNELNQRWVRRAIETTARDLLNNRKEYVKCSPLYHSVNALNIYLDRVNPRKEPPQIAEAPSPRTAMVRPEERGRKVPVKGISKSRVLEGQAETVDDIASQPITTDTAPEASRPLKPSTPVDKNDEASTPLPPHSAAEASAAKDVDSSESESKQDAELPLTGPIGGRLNSRIDRSVADAVIQNRMDELAAEDKGLWKPTNPDRTSTAADDASESDKSTPEVDSQKADSSTDATAAQPSDSTQKLDPADDLIELKPVDADSERLRVVVPPKSVSLPEAEAATSKLAPLMAKKKSADEKPRDEQAGSAMLVTEDTSRSRTIVTERPMLPGRLHTGSRRSNPFSIERPISRTPLTIPTTTVSQSRTLAREEATVDSRDAELDHSLKNHSVENHSAADQADEADRKVISEDEPEDDVAAQKVKSTEFITVPAGINDRFLDPNLNPEEWINRFEVESREIYAERHAIVKAIGLSAGHSIADIGAGTGLFTELFSKTVGSKGKVYAIDISPRLITFLENRVTAEGMSNVSVVRNDATSTQLVSQKIDKAFVCDTYHHFERPDAMLKSIHRALNEGGELVLIDFERIPGKSRDWVIGHVRAGKGTFRSEIEASGFDFVKEVKVDGFKENYLLIFRKQ